VDDKVGKDHSRNDSEANHNDTMKPGDTYTKDADAVVFLSSGSGSGEDPVVAITPIVESSESYIEMFMKMFGIDPMEFMKGQESDNTDKDSDNTDKDSDDGDDERK